MLPILIHSSVLNTCNKPVDEYARDKNPTTTPLGVFAGKETWQRLWATQCCKGDQFGLQNEFFWNIGSEGLLVLSRGSNCATSVYKVYLSHLVLI